MDAGGLAVSNLPKYVFIALRIQLPYRCMTFHCMREQLDYCAWKINQGGCISELI